MKATTILLITSIFTIKTYAQNLKIGLQGGTYSPYALYNGIAKKNPMSRLNRYSTSNPYCISLGLLYDKGRVLFGLNTYLRSLNIQQTLSTNADLINSKWETYDFDLNIGYKLIKTPKSYFNGLIGVGIQRMSVYDNESSVPFFSKESDSSIVVTKFSSQIKSQSQNPVYLNLKLEGGVKLSERFDFFVSFESVIFLKSSYYLRHTWRSTWNGDDYFIFFDGESFTNNSISSTIGFRYTIQKSKKIETPFER